MTITKQSDNRMGRVMDFSEAFKESLPLMFHPEKPCIGLRSGVLKKLEGFLVIMAGYPFLTPFS